MPPSKARASNSSSQFNPDIVPRSQDSETKAEVLPTEAQVEKPPSKARALNPSSQFNPDIVPRSQDSKRKAEVLPTEAQASRNAFHCACIIDVSALIPLPQTM